jgi:transketolase
VATTDLEHINTIRILAAEAVQKANSGHPGMPMEAAPLAYLLWTRFMRYNPENPAWVNRDRFVLSAGHGSMLIYAMLHLTGYNLSLEEIKNFRQWNSLTPGHPEYGLTPGVDTTTGPLGQGISTAVGMAMAEAHLGARFNRPGHDVIDHFTYVIASDGDLMEGVSSEACSMAGHLGLGKMIVVYLDNHITIEGSTDLAFSENVGLRFDAYGWHVQRVMDGNDLASLESAIHAAQGVTDKPSIIVCRTIIGYGSPNRAGTSKAHGEALGEEELALTKKNLGWPAEPAFYIPEDVLTHFRQMASRGNELESAWKQNVDAYTADHPDLSREMQRCLNGDLPEGWENDLPIFTPDLDDMATRQASGTVINALAARIPELMGGSADLAGSNNTMIEAETDYAAGHYIGRNLRFGVREHAMGAALNGMMVHGGVIAYGGTFLVFSDYMRPAIRLAALMVVAPIYVFTHESVGLGEDGPTHQPIEHYMALRVIPHLIVIRPSDATETAEAWRAALLHRNAPVALLLTRQKMPVLDRTTLASAEGLQQGAYILADAEGPTPDVILIATGSEVHVALAAREMLAAETIGARVVSMPSWELFEAQPADYKESVLPTSVTARLAIEAGVTLGWERYVGTQGDVIGIDRFGASAPAKIIFEQLGFTAENAAARAKALLDG